MDAKTTEHVPVLLKELLDLLQPKPNENFIDATLGGGGMASAVLDKIAPDGIVVGIEHDLSAIKRTKSELARYKNRLVIKEGNFGELEALAAPEIRSIHGIYFDFGISSDQLEDNKRGISFQYPDAPLDMRMAQTEDSFTAAQLLMNSAEDDLAAVFKKYGEEPRAKRIAKAVIDYRKEKEIVKVSDLLEIIQSVYTNKYYKRHPGTKVWQALRIVVNNELEAIEKALPQAFAALAPGGRLAAISFHSLEDRIVKHYFKTLIKAGAATTLTKKVITPTETEIKINPRSRSAKLRGVQKGE